MLGRLFTHASWYTMGSLLTTLASFISFPLLARTFTVAEYGVLNLISVTMLLLVGLAKSGVQHSVVRFYGDVVAANDPQYNRRYRATVLYGMLLTGAVITVLWAITSQLLPSGIWAYAGISSLLLIAASMVLTRTVDSAFINMLRAQERSTAYSVYQVIKKYLALLGTVIALWWFAGGLTEYYFAMLITETLVVIGLAAFMFRDGPWRPSEFDPRLYRTMMAFGIPMIGYEVMGIVLNAGDRYIISWFEGNEAVGIYSAAYNLCEYVEAIFIVSVAQAIQPIYVRLWKTSGAEETSAFLGKALHLYIAGGAIVVGGVSAIGPELITLLASEKYLAGSDIIPLIMVGMMLRGSVMIIGAGLYLHLQPKSSMMLVTVVAVLNILLNIALVPFMGIMGAAVATALCCVVQVVGVSYLSARWLKVRVPWPVLAKYLVVAGLVYQCASSVHVDNDWLSLLAKMVAGAAVTLPAVLLLDKEMRHWSLLLLERMGLPASWRASLRKKSC